MDRRQRYIEDAIFVRVYQVCERILEALLVELDKIEAALPRFYGFHRSLPNGSYRNRLWSFKSS